MKDEQFEVKGNWHFTMIDNAIFEDERVTITDQSVYVALCSFANVENHECFPSYPTLMRKAHLKNRNALRNALKRLEEYGFILVERNPGGVNRYTVWTKDTSTGNVLPSTLGVLPSTLKVLPQYAKRTLTKANNKNHKLD